MIEENLKKILSEISSGNDLGEEITLVGATKFVPVDAINAAISAGLTHIGENKAQELRDKFDFYKPVYKHFIGRIQSNKLKYIVGKADCIDSVDDVKIAEEISLKATALGLTQKIMLEVNIGGEEEKGGFSAEKIFAAYEEICSFKNITVIGLMSMLPAAGEDEVASLTRRMRKIFDALKTGDENMKYLSVGISSDYKTAIKNGSNMIRLGTAIFGERNYGGK